MITVSVVDDISVVREVLAKLINRTDDLRCVSTHATAQEALREIPRVRPRVVLMDVKLPGLSGVKCAQRLKALTPDLRVLLLSVDSSGETVRR
ncbi:MAG: response regulator, partial [Verrucomicrobia bacterium]|nr:response regulator [Verrucomicrobiota bacterium]